jgi:hypothetical protein
MQSQRTLPTALLTSSARCPIAKTWVEADACQAKVVTPDNPATLGQRLAREPLLALPVHILPLILADRTGCRRRSCVRKLGTALFAGPQGHGGCSKVAPARRKGDPCKKLKWQYPR